MATRTRKRAIDVRIFPPFRSSLRVAWLRQVASAALAAADPEGTAGVSVVVADDATLHALNARFRGLDEVTDVLSFGDVGDSSLGDTDMLMETGTPFPAMPDEEASWGEVVLSYPLAVRQAGEHNVTVAQEVALLVVHGVLHLLGYDHAEADDQAAMQAMETQALASVFPAAAVPQSTGGLLG